MRNKRLFSLTISATAFFLLLSGCSKQTEPVMADSIEEITEPEKSLENTEPTPSPTIEPTKEPVEGKEEIEEEIPSGEMEQEESESDLGYEIIPIDDTTMYCTSNSANIRKGPNTDYDIVGSLSYSQEIVVNGKVEDDDKLWYVIKTDNEEIEMVSASLLSATKPVQQSSTVLFFRLKEHSICRFFW